MTKVVCLMVKSGPLQGHKYFVKTDSPISIGRSEEANIRIAYDEFCSRKHALVYWENDTCYIRDLDSTNGTQVNGNRIEGISKLNHQDIINLGNTELLVAVAERQKDEKTGLDDDVSYED